jgi:hypothetical protein
MSLKKRLKDKLKTKKKSKGAAKLNVFASVERLESKSSHSGMSDDSRHLEYPNSPPWIHFT